ncbi:MAG: hypothetical protein MdMp014T_0798 [Treponematales bacterium]
MAIPKTDEGLREFSANLIAKCNEKKAVWGIPDAAVTQIQGLHTDYDAKLAAAKASNHRKSDTVAKNQSKKALIAGLTVFIGTHVEFNNAVGEVERAEIGLPPKDKTWTPVERPDRSPLAWAEIIAARMIAVHYKAEGAAGKARPKGYNGAVIRYIVLPAGAPAPLSENDLTKSLLSTRTPHIFEFAAEERGMRFYFSLAWQTEGGAKLGPFSEILSELVP